MKLTFWGAARQVTGSMFLLELEEDYRLLIDCGFDMGEKDEEGAIPAPEQSLKQFPFEASMVNAVVLTHAHMDHSGNLPNLLLEGFEGQILCSTPTLHLSHLLMMDAANIHAKKIKAIRKRSGGTTNTTQDLSHLYQAEQVDETVDRMVPIAFNKPFTLKPGLRITLIPCGHLLGAANILVEAKENDQWVRIGFSGDIGRKNYPLLSDPEPFPQVDYLVCESTYGNRRHSQADPMEAVREAVEETCVKQPGRLIIPAFSIGRTQAILYTMTRLHAEQGYSPVPIYYDSPLAMRSSQIYQKLHRYLSQEAQDFLEENETLFQMDEMHYVADSKRSRALSDHSQPSIIVSASGMISGGRIENHIEANLKNPYATIFMVGFAAEGTFGHTLRNSKGSVRFKGREYEVLARIQSTDAFSGHGDLDDLLRFIGQQDPKMLQKLFIVHGDEEAMEDLEASLNLSGYQQTEIPEKGQTFQLRPEGERVSADQQ